MCICVQESGKEALSLKAGDVAEAGSREGRQHFLLLISKLGGRKASCPVMLNQLESLRKQ